MKALFRISTERVSLDWRSVTDNPPAILATRLPFYGTLKVTTRTGHASLLGDTWKSVPEQIEHLPDINIGPALFEETDYQLFMRAKNVGDTVDIQHRDPLLRRRLASEEGGSVLCGVLNFRGQIGRSEFTVLINGRPELDFEVEVFPTKVDYESDYKQILADIQEILTGLAYEYLRSTFQLGKAEADAKPTRLEWLILLRHIVEDLDKAVRHIAQQPQRRLVRRSRTVRIEQLKRIDAAVRSQVRRAQGRGAFVLTSRGPVRERLTEFPPESTMDTMEHRWIKRQLTDIQRTLAQILASYKGQGKSDRDRAAINELTGMERCISRMLHVEPFREANGEVSAGFASLQLLSTPGYREAYQLCMLLRTGLRLEGETLRLNVKDLSVLYEYWAFLAMIRIVRDEYGHPEHLRDLFRISQSGVGVRFLQGRGQTVAFQAGTSRRISIIYNPQFDDRDTTLIPQKPDILIRFEEQGWPCIQLICDAKYRIDASEEYRNQYKSPGPPAEAINVLHRYRDAILEFDGVRNPGQKPKRSVIQAAAVFPYDEQRPGEFRESRLWQSIERLGIGAIPALPSNRVYLREWLTSAIREGGWALADRIIPHVAEQRAINWRIAASEPVLIGVLPSPNAQERLDWISKAQVYYHPLPKSPHRHFRVACVALYSPKSLLQVPGISHVAEVETIEVCPRQKIATPWRPRGTGDELMLMYRLRPITPLTPIIENRDDDATTFRTDRWTSRLGLSRARTAIEIILETEPEWKLYELLSVQRLSFKIAADRVRLENATAPAGRAWFLLPTFGKVRFDGSNGFIFVDSATGQTSYHSLSELAHLLEHRKPESCDFDKRNTTARR